jgi:hypothetical protein
MVQSKRSAAGAVVAYNGEDVYLRLLARQKGFHEQTIIDRWIKQGKPGVVTDESLFYPAVIGGSNGMQVTLEGKLTTVRELVKKTGLSEPSVYKRLQKYGPDLRHEHLHVDDSRRNRALGAWRARKQPAAVREKKQYGYDPEDRSPGWCERKYDFLKNAGAKGYASVDRCTFSGRTSSGSNVYSGE